MLQLFPNAYLSHSVPEVQQTCNEENKHNESNEWLCYFGRGSNYIRVGQEVLKSLTWEGVMCIFVNTYYWLTFLMLTCHIWTGM